MPDCVYKMGNLRIVDLITPVARFRIFTPRWI